MPDRFEVAGLLERPQHKVRDVISDQDTDDIITGMLRFHKKWAKEYDKISELFWAGNARATAFRIWSFLKDQIPYRLESDRQQTVKSPAAILLYDEMPGGTDCKHYSLFAGGVLDSLRRKGYPINWVYRFVSYKYGDPVVHHVFVVLKDGDREYWIDPVLNRFDDRSKQYYYYLDKKPKGMLSEISGIGESPCAAQYITNPTGGEMPGVAFSASACPTTITAQSPKTFTAWWGGLSTIEKILLIGVGAGLIYSILKK